MTITFGISTVFAQISENDARQAIAAKKFKQAREIYIKLAGEQPEKLAYKIWIARLSAWLSELPRALKEYDEILRENPTNNEALLGKVYVLMWQKKYGKAKTVLAIAEKNGRYDTAFLVTKINFFRYQNKLKEARETVKTAREANAENAEVKELEQILEKTHATAFEVGCEQSFEPFTATSSSCFANATVQKGNDQIALKAQSGKRFGRIYRELGISWKHEVNANLTVIAKANLVPQKSVEVDTNLGVDYKINARLNVGIDYRFWRLNRRNIGIFSSNLSYSINSKTNLQTTLYNSSNNVLLLRFNRQITKPLSVSLSYVKSFENLKTTSPSFSQNAAVVSGKYQVTKNLTISGSYGLTRKGTEPAKKIYGFGFTLTR